MRSCRAVAKLFAYRYVRTVGLPCKISNNFYSIYSSLQRQIWSLHIKLNCHLRQISRSVNRNYVQRLFVWSKQMFEVSSNSFHTGAQPSTPLMTIASSMTCCYRPDHASPSYSRNCNFCITVIVLLFLPCMQCASVLWNTVIAAASAESQTPARLLGVSS